MNKLTKKLLSLILASIMLFSIIVPSSASILFPIIPTYNFKKESQNFVLQKKVNGKWQDVKTVNFKITGFENIMKSVPVGTCSFELESKYSNNNIQIKNFRIYGYTDAKCKLPVNILDNKYLLEDIDSYIYFNFYSSAGTLAFSSKSGPLDSGVVKVWFKPQTIKN